jgi:hypothetical protein
MKEVKLEILQTKIVINVNEPSLLPEIPPPLGVPSLLTAFQKIKQITTDWSAEEADGSLRIEEKPAEAQLSFWRKEDSLFLQGPILEFMKKCTDTRYTLWGNLGLLYRFILYLLEKKHGLYSLHACALYDEEQNQLIVIAGGAGSGKTVFLLSGLAFGLKLFSTETTHFQVKGDKIIWFKGSLVDNIRLSTLEKHFPAFLPSASSLPASALYKEKIAIDLSSYQTSFDQIDQLSRVIFIFPHIEEGWPQREESPLSEPNEVARRLYTNISSKLDESIILYDSLPLVGWDEAELAQKRWTAIKSLLTSSLSLLSLNILSDPADCWGNLLSHLRQPKKLKEN